MDKDYSKREIDTFMREIHEKLDLILAQTIKTNGRVNKHDTQIGMLWGGVAVGAFIIPLVISLIK